jgi:hypothetical protein
MFKSAIRHLNQLMKRDRTSVAAEDYRKVKGLAEARPHLLAAPKRRDSAVRRD